MSEETTKDRRLNIRVDEETHYWLNLDAARYGRSLQAHLDTMLTKHAGEIKKQFGGVRPEGVKGATVYPTGGSPGFPLNDGE